MNTFHAALVRDSYDAVSPRITEATTAFYARLFEIAPAVRALFPSDMARQREHLAAAVALVARNADRLSSLAEPLRQMGARHSGYGAQPEHYAVVRDVLVETLAKTAGPTWDEATTRAWTAALNSVAGYMLEGAERAKAAGPAPSATANR